MKRVISSQQASRLLPEVLPNALYKRFGMFIYDRKTSPVTGSEKYVYYDGPDYNTPAAQELTEYLNGINARLSANKILFTQRIHGSWSIIIPKVNVPIESL